jgi:Domain of unknown function (DUF4864)
MQKRLVLAGIVAALVALAPALLRAEVGEGDRAAIRQVIEAQLAAFQRDDGPGAYAFATPMIQEKFVNPDIFMDMVRTGYPAVYRPREVQFRELVEENGRLMQKVFLVGPDGRPVLAVYEMQRQPEGVWRINGCWIVAVPEESV